MVQQPQQQQQPAAGAAMPVTRSLLTVEQFAERHPAFTVGSLRAKRFDSKGNANGFAAAFKVVGKRVYIDEAEFFACIDALNVPEHTNSRRRKRRTK